MTLFVSFWTLKGSFDIEILDLKNKNLENDLKLDPSKVNLKTLHTTKNYTHNQKPPLFT